VHMVIAVLLCWCQRVHRRGFAFNLLPIEEISDIFGNFCGKEGKLSFYFINGKKGIMRHYYSKLPKIA
jgi:hypothetical protein